MKIALKRAYDILENASAVIVDGWVLVYPALAGLENSDEHEFMYLSWDNEGDEHTLEFYEGNNQEVEVMGSSMFLYDSRSKDHTDHTQLTILIPLKME